MDDSTAPIPSTQDPDSTTIDTVIPSPIQTEEVIQESITTPLPQEPTELPVVTLGEPVDASQSIDTTIPDSTVPAVINPPVDLEPQDVMLPKVAPIVPTSAPAVPESVQLQPTSPIEATPAVVKQPPELPSEPQAVFVTLSPEPQPVAVPVVPTQTVGDIPQKVLDLTPEELAIAHRLWAQRNIASIRQKALQARIDKKAALLSKLEAIVKQNAPLTRRQIADKAHMSLLKTASYLRVLVKSGRVRATGSTRKRRYR